MANRDGLFSSILDQAVNLGFDYGRQQILGEDQTYKNEQIALSGINGSGPLLDGRQRAMDSPTGEVEFAFGSGSQTTPKAESALKGAGFMGIGIMAGVGFFLYKLAK